MGFGDRLKRAIQVVVGGHSVGRTVVKGATINSGAYRPKQGEEWLHAYNTMPWLRANVSKIAGGVAGLEWGISRTMDDNGMTVKRPDLQRGGYDYRRKVLAAMEDEEKADTTFDHPFLTLLKNPCPALPGKAALILAQVYYEIVGEVFFVVDRGSRDEWLLKSKVGRPLPTALWPIPPTWVKRVPTPDQPTFEIRQSGLQMMDIPLTEVLWLKNPDPVNPYARGVGLFNSLSDELDSDENAAKMISYSFYNRNRPDVLVSLPGADEIELRAFRNDWVSSLQGVTNALKNHFVNVEAKVEQLGYDFREMQVIDLRKHTRDTIRQVPGVPPEILGIQDQSNRATIDAAEYIFSKHVVVPRAEVWRDFWQTQCVVEYDDRAILDYVTPVQEDKNFTLNIVTGRPEVVKVNEIRKLGGLPALTDEEGGNLFFVGGTFVPTLVPAAPAGPVMPGAEAGAGAGLSIPGFEGGINVPGAPQMHLAVPGAAGSAESGLPASVGAPQGPPGGNPPPPPGAGPVRPPAPPAPDGNGPGYTLAGRTPEPDGTDPGAEVNRFRTRPQAAFRKGYPQGGAVREAARNFRPRTLARAEVTPDEAILISKWFAANDYEVDPSAILKTAPIPLTDDRATEWLRRSMAYLAGTPTKSWNPMFGPWTQHDTDLVDTMLKGDLEGHPFRGNQWTTGQGGGGDRDVEESGKEPVAGWDLKDPRLQDTSSAIAILSGMMRGVGKANSTFTLAQFLTLHPNYRTQVGPRQWDGVRKDAEAMLDLVKRIGTDPEEWKKAFGVEGRDRSDYIARQLERFKSFSEADTTAALEKVIEIAKDSKGASAAFKAEARESAKAKDEDAAAKLPGLDEVKQFPTTAKAVASLSGLAWNPEDGTSLQPVGVGGGLAERSFHNEGPEINMGRMDPRLASLVVDEVKALAQEFDEEMKNLGYIGLGTREDRVTAMAHFTQSHETNVRGFEIGKHERILNGQIVDYRTMNTREIPEGQGRVEVRGIALNGSIFTSPAEAYRAHGVESESDFHDGMKDVRSTMRHEFGHHLDTLADDSGFAGFRQWKARNWGDDPEVGRIASETRGRQEVHGGNLAREISGYAAKNGGELLAETFAVIKYGDDKRKAHPAARELAEEIEKFKVHYRAWKAARSKQASQGRKP